MSELIEKLARVIYDDLEGPVANQDFARQQRQWERAQQLARAVLSTLADNLTPEMVEAGLQAQCDLPGCEWTDAVSDGLAMVMRLKMEKALTAALRSAVGE